MKKILNLQEKFIKHIYQSSNEEILDNLPYSKEEALARMEIYRNNIFGNYLSVLSSNYEVVENLVGEEYFEKLALSFCQKYHSKSGNLDDYGFEFPNFIKSKKKQHKLDYLHEIANLELLYHKSYFIADNNEFNLENFQKISEEDFFNLTFTLHKSCFLLSSKFPLFSIWKDNIENNGKNKINLNKKEFILIDNALGKVMMSNLSEEEFIFLDQISKGKNLYETYKIINRKIKKEVDIGQILQKFISSRTINNFKKGALK